MTKVEVVLASRLLGVAAEEFSNHICNDMDSAYFEGLTQEDLKQLESRYNAWNGGEQHIPLRNIGNHSWMAYLAALIKAQIVEG